MMDAIITEDDRKDSIYKIEKNILSLNKPSSWNIYDDENLERKIEVDFAKYCVSVSKYSGIDLEKSSVFKFYAAVEQIENELKPNKNG